MGRISLQILLGLDDCLPNHTGSINWKVRGGRELIRDREFNHILRLKLALCLEISTVHIFSRRNNTENWVDRIERRVFIERPVSSIFPYIAHTNKEYCRYFLKTKNPIHFLEMRNFETGLILCSRRSFSFLSVTFNVRKKCDWNMILTKDSIQTPISTCISWIL